MELAELDEKATKARASIRFADTLLLEGLFARLGIDVHAWEMQDGGGSQPQMTQPQLQNMYSLARDFGRWHINRLSV
jgi:hypothetical protein